MHIFFQESQSPNNTFGVQAPVPSKCKLVIPNAAGSLIIAVLILIIDIHIVLSNLFGTVLIPFSTLSLYASSTLSYYYINPCLCPLLVLFYYKRRIFLYKYFNRRFLMALHYIFLLVLNVLGAGLRVDYTYL